MHWAQRQRTGTHTARSTHAEDTHAAQLVHTDQTTRDRQVEALGELEILLDSLVAAKVDIDEPGEVRQQRTKLQENISENSLNTSRFCLSVLVTGVWLHRASSSCPSWKCDGSDGKQAHNGQLQFFPASLLPTAATGVQASNDEFDLNIKSCSLVLAQALLQTGLIDKNAHDYHREDRERPNGRTPSGVHCPSVTALPSVLLLFHSCAVRSYSPQPW